MAGKLLELEVLLGSAGVSGLLSGSQDGPPRAEKPIKGLRGPSSDSRKAPGHVQRDSSLLFGCSAVTPNKGESRWDRRLHIPPPGGAFWQSLSAAHFLVQQKSECHFFNGTQRVRFLDRYIYDRQEIDYFDSDLGKYVAVTPLGQPDVDKWNSDKIYMQYLKARVDSSCRYNYEGLQADHIVGRRVSISPTKLDPASPNTILLCTARGFYPVEIKVRWLKNGRPEEEGVAFGEELQNGDWTYQLQVMLETQPQQGDIYICQVEHASLEAPITVQWVPRSSNSAKSKLWTGIVAAVIGVIFFAMGLSLYLKSKTGEEKTECHFFNGTQRVRFLDRDIYDRQEIRYFDSDLGKYVAVTPLGQPAVDKWNSDKAILQFQKACVDSFCRYNYGTAQRASVVGRR
ncbi:H-2 class II histocompatibility antigen, E-S beta chain-like, partial [Protobothrops mucrosquamatus]|uniref:H-2 class II histocompatibility antigen, E-S beta chain-like n=1 Tax=Protobothrops mucrosquamatus TaxID=103944 RepID=UPI0010FB354C